MSADAFPPPEPQLDAINSFAMRDAAHHWWRADFWHRMRQSGQVGTPPGPWQPQRQALCDYDPFAFTEYHRP